MSYTQSDAAIEGFCRLALELEKHDNGKLPGANLLNEVRVLVRHVTQDFDENGYYIA